MRRLSIALLAVLLLGLLAACGGGSKQKATATAATSSGGASSPAASAGTATAASTAATTGTPAASPAALATQPASGAATATTTQSASATQPAGGTSQPAGQTPAATAAPSGGPSVASGSFAYGFNVFTRGDADGAAFNQKTIDEVKGAGFNWVRIQVQWSDIERAKNQWDPLPLDRIVQQYQGSGVKVLASVAKAPDWALDPSGEHFLKDYADWEGFMHFLAERYRGKIQAWEIWNEQNLASEMGGTVRLQDYCNMLQTGYRGVKLADKDALVVFGGLTPTGVNDPKIAINDLEYLQQFYALRGGFYAQFFDVLGMHVSATDNAPDLMYPENPGSGNWSNDPSFYFKRAEQLHQVMETNQDTRPVYITEFGWTTANQAKGYEYGANVTPEDQAKYLVRAFEIARQDWPWTQGMFVWNLNFAVVAPPSDEKSPWSVLNSDWSPRPAYTALKEMPKS